MLKKNKMKTHYYLIDGKIVKGEKLPENRNIPTLNSSWNKWYLSLYSCSISDVELEKIEIYLNDNSYDGDWKQPIEVTDIISDNNGVITFKEKENNIDSDIWFINNLIGLAKIKLELLKENKIKSVDRVELSNWINNHIKQPKQVEEIEAVDGIWDELFELFRTKRYGDKMLEELKSKFTITRK